MNIVNLDENERQQFYRMLYLDKFKSVADKSVETLCLQKFKKAYTRVTKAQLEQYIEENLTASNDLIINCCVEAVIRKISDEFKPIHKLEHSLRNQDYKAIDPIVKEQVELKRGSYEKCNFPLSFDNLVKICCKTDKKKKKIAKLKKEYSNLRNEAEKEVDKAEKEKKKLEKEIGEKDKEIVKLNEILSIKNINNNLSEILGENSLKGKTYDELYTELSSLENKTIDTQDYDRRLIILAAKFTITRILKGIQ